LEYWESAGVGGELPVDIPNDSDMPLLVRELGRAPVQMPVDPVLIVGAVVREVSGQAGYDGKFVARLRIEIRVSTASINGAVTDAEIG
jgi:hypothetical protein